MQMGADTWFERQLDPASIPDAAGDAAVAPYRAVFAPPEEIPKLFAKQDVPADYEDGEDVPPNVRLNKLTDFQRVIRSLQMAEIARHAASERQVYEVMVDFWVNHFNVFARKGMVKLYAADYVEHAIRPNALGRFEDLLVATARHPAMLIYLDNAKSSAPPGPGASGKRKNRGITENYARELLELHTLGVNGGYTQQDVVEVARVLTGWSVAELKQGRFGFEYRERAHDTGSKVVLGETYPAGHGQDEGLHLLHQLALHPSTARHLATKLCARFVSDQPPAGCVEGTARAYLDSGGDIRSTLRSLERSPEFWAPRARRSKIKSPLEFIVSALRAVGAGLDGSNEFAKVTDRLGQAPLLEPVPTGYPETAEDWASTSGALLRMNFAAQLAGGKLDGANVELERLFGGVDGADAVVRRINDVVLAGNGSTHTLDTIRDEIEHVVDPDQQKALAVALALGSPDFQKQ